jgi:hypothetical protein
MASNEDFENNKEYRHAMCLIRPPRTENDKFWLHHHCELNQKIDYNSPKTFTGNAYPSSIVEGFEKPNSGSAQYVHLGEYCNCPGMGCPGKNNTSFVNTTGRYVKGEEKKEEKKEGYTSFNRKMLGVYDKVDEMCPPGLRVIDRGVPSKGMYKL